MSIRASPFLAIVGEGTGGQAPWADLAQQTALAYKVE